MRSIPTPSDRCRAGCESRPRAIRATALLAAALVAAIVLAALVAVATGSAAIEPETVLRMILRRTIAPGLATDWSTAAERIVLELRLPRVVLGLMVGAGLAVTGLVLQTLTRNPLADPYLFGVSAGASVGAVLVITQLGDLIGPATLPVAAFAGAMLALVAVIGIAGPIAAAGRERLVLAGVAVSFVLMAVTNVLIFLGDQRAAQAVVFWMLGGLGLARWDLLPIPTIAVVAALGLLWLHARRLDALLLGDDTATTLGVNVARLRLVLFVLCSILTGALVALAGSIGFIGLMVPHMARVLVGVRHALLVPITALCGALMVVVVDILARVLLDPQELPLGIITGSVGGAYVIWLIRCHRLGT